MAASNAGPLLSAGAPGTGTLPLNSLRTRQIAALKRMLNLNVPQSKTSMPTEPVWKVLIYDKYGQDIISPLLTVKELRSLGVTLHILVDSQREPIPDASAVYFIVPSASTVVRLCRDCHSHLYDSMYFNFITPIGRPLLEDLAKAAVESNSSTQVMKVFDQYLNFISLEENLFITRHQDKTDISYYALNRPDAKDTDITAIRDIIVDSLFSVFVTAGVVPIIRCPSGNAAEMVAEALDTKLRDNLRDVRNSMFTGENLPVGQMSFSRPLLVILDRNMDLATALHHTWTYQALVHDVFELDLNRVTMPLVTDSTTDASTKSYDLHITDKFWNSHRGSPFPTVADAVQTEVNEYRTREEEVTRLRSAMGMSEDDANIVSDNLSESTAKLTSALSTLPELIEQKARIDMHTNIATALLDQIKARKLDLFFEMEDKMISKSSMDKSVMDIITDPSAGTAEDKLRLFLIYYILSPELSEQEVTQCLTALQTVGADLSAIDYIKKWKAYAKMATNPRLTSGPSSSSMSTMLSQFVHTSSKYVLEGVKNLVIRTKNLPVTRVVDQLMEAKPSKETDDYRSFDPKLQRGDSSVMLRARGPFQEAYVFVVGGGNYIEYQNLQDYCARQQVPKSITYGTTELMDASEFLSQLCHLGQASD